MSREGRPFWWPRCGSCGRWLSWDWSAQTMPTDLDAPLRWRCIRCTVSAADAYEKQTKEDTHA